MNEDRRSNVGFEAASEELPEGRADQGECDTCSTRKVEKPHQGITGPKCKMVSEDVEVGTWFLG